jgi:hypothetical protein
MVSLKGSETFRGRQRLIQTKEGTAMDSAAIESLTGLFGVMVPIVAIVLGIGLAFWSVYWKHQRRRLQYQERQLMIEKGMVPPPELPEDNRRMIGRTPEDCLRRGTVLLFLGIGLAVGAAVLQNFMDDREFVGLVALAAAVVGFIGLGNLVYYFIARRKPEDAVPTL